MHPDPLETHPFLKLLHSKFEIKLVGASVHLRSTQAVVSVSEVPKHIPSDPISLEQIVLLP